MLSVSEAVSLPARVRCAGAATQRAWWRAICGTGLVASEWGCHGLPRMVIGALTIGGLAPSLFDAVGDTPTRVIAGW